VHATPADFTEVERVRQALRKLLRGRVLITPKADGTCELSGQADYGKLFSGIPLATALASEREPPAVAGRVSEEL